MARWRRCGGQPGDPPADTAGPRASVSRSYAFWIFSNISRPAGFLSGWYFTASLRYALRISLSSDPTGMPSVPYASSGLPTFSSLLVSSARQPSSTARSRPTGSRMGQSGKRVSSHRLAR
jgi:hypothetical protein